MREIKPVDLDTTKIVEGILAETLRANKIEAIVSNETIGKLLITSSATLEQVQKAITPGLQSASKKLYQDFYGNRLNSEIGLIRKVNHGKEIEITISRALNDGEKAKLSGYLTVGEHTKSENDHGHNGNNGVNGSTNGKDTGTYTNHVNRGAEKGVFTAKNLLEKELRIGLAELNINGNNIKIDQVRKNGKVFIVKVPEIEQGEFKTKIVDLTVENVSTALKGKLKTKVSVSEKDGNIVITAKNSTALQMEAQQKAPITPGIYQRGTFKA